MRITLPWANRVRRTYDPNAPFFQALELDTAPFFQELERAIFEEFDSPFFRELDALIEQDRQAARQAHKRALHRNRYAREARRVAVRIARVKSISLHKLAQHIPNDFFDNPHLRFEYVKTIHERKECILWHLTGLYYFFAFCEKSHAGWKRSNGLGYKGQREIFHALLIEHRAKTIERERQRKWDKKRERVKRQREKKMAKADVPRHIYKTHFNGHVFVDPWVRTKGYAILDDGFSRAEKVYVHKLGKVLAQVSREPDTPQYAVLVNRLTRINQVKEKDTWD